MRTFQVNGTTHSVDVTPDTPLLWVLRDTLGRTGTRYGCGVVARAACSVPRDHARIRARVTPIGSVLGHQVTAIGRLAHTQSPQRRGPGLPKKGASTARSGQGRSCRPWPGGRRHRIRVRPPGPETSVALGPTGVSSAPLTGPPPWARSALRARRPRSGPPLGMNRSSMLRIHETRVPEQPVVPSAVPPGGVRAPGVPPSAPAIRNTVLAATGRRLPAGRTPWVA